MRCLSGVFAASAANVNAELMLKRSQSLFQRTNHARSNAGGMPVHSHHSPERLKPEWMCDPAQQFVAPIVMNDSRADHCPKT